MIRSIRPTKFSNGTKPTCDVRSPFDQLTLRAGSAVIGRYVCFFSFSATRGAK
jgi:hypothetical protein